MIDFDSYAGDYEAALHRGLAISGESQAFFAKERIAWLARCLKSQGFVASTVLDYGCGNGTTAPYLVEILGARSVIGVDVSEKSLEIARRSRPELPVEYALTSEYAPNGSVDLVYCNGVLHHVEQQDRASIVAYMSRCLRPGGKLALYENNPWNPGTRLIMKRIPFDRNAKMLTAKQMRALLEVAGLQEIRRDYLFVYPRVLSFLRFTEALLTRFPLGAQYQILAHKSN